MKSFNKPSIMFVALSILLPLSVRASQTVRVVEDLGDAQASFTCQKQGATEKLALDIPVIALNDISLGGRQFKSLTLPASDMLFPGETSEEGLPDMPVLSSLLILPDAADPVLSVEYSGFELIEDVDIEPIQSPIPEGSSEIPPFTQNSDFYSQDRYYPENLAEYGEPAILRDIRFSQISIYPVQYNPARRELKVYHDLQVSVSYDYQHVTNPKTTRSSYLSDGFYPIYKSLFANFEELFSNTPVKRGGYLFICKPALVDSLKALVLWKHQKGYTTRIVPTTEIYSGGNPTYSQIFNYLRTAYQTWEIPPEYVNIVGDRDGSFAIPFYPYGSGYVSDNPYSCVDGADYLPDIFVGRMSVDQMQELRKLISKVFYYEKTPRMDDPQHWVRGLCVGYTLFQTARTIPLWARQLELQNGFAQVDTVFASSSTPLLTQYMNAGPGIVFYRGEAGTDGWWGPTYSISDLNAMPNNQQLGILAPIACGMGDFGQECFGEVWIRMGYGPDSLKGGPVFYGTSEHFGHTKWSNPLSIGFFWGIFGQGAYHASAAMVASKMQLYRTFPHANSNGGMVNQYFSTYNILG
ncbi:MAG TPA: hypothetical protein DCZ43_12690, partial [candidate division Zixibacteria bacterium]|nr:hypothetical protein [candidate division Zixibacteria bacterium]